MREKKTRNKTTRNFFLLMLAGGILGGLLGFFTIFFGNQLTGLTGILNTGLLSSSPWVLTGICLFTLLLAFLALQKGKTLSRAWDGEDETAYEQIDKILNTSLGASSVGMILSMTWYGLLVVSVTNNLCSLNPFLGVTFCFLLSAVFHSLLQRKCVDVLKKLNPEKRGDALSLHFQKEWLQSCDEQEKLAVYQACYKSFLALPMISLVLLVILILSSFLFDVGPLPFLVIGCMWLIQTVIYFMESAKNKPIQ